MFCTKLVNKVIFIFNIMRSNIQFENDSIVVNKDIEKRFKQLLSMQYSYSDTPTTPVTIPIIPNGIHPHGYLIRDSDDTMTFLKNTDTICIPKTQLTEFLKFYHTHHNTDNIYIDSRLSAFIIYAIIKYSEDVLIYDAYSNKIKTVYFYISDTYHFQTIDMNFLEMKVFLLTQLLFNTYCPFLRTIVSVQDTIKYIKTLYIQRSSNMVIDVMMNCIGVPDQENNAISPVYDLIKCIHDSFSEKAYVDFTQPVVCDAWNIKDLTPYHVFQVLNFLKKHQYYFYPKCLVLE